MIGRARQQPEPLRLIEYGEPSDLREFSTRSGIPVEHLRDSCTRANRRIRESIGIEGGIQSFGNLVEAQRIAGLLRASPKFEMEVSPKFLDASSPGWREDFFAIATVTQFGRVFPFEALPFSLAAGRDLPDLIARVAVEMMNRLSSRPLWVYRVRGWESFEISGEIDPESVRFPGPDGFQQLGIVLDTNNEFTHVIYEALSRLYYTVKDQDLREQLQLCMALMKVKRLPLPKLLARDVPRQHRNWRPLYQLCLGYLQGSGLDFEMGELDVAPGYIVDTAKAWESFVRMALHSGLPGSSVRRVAHHLGRTRNETQVGSGPWREVNCSPDVTIVRQSDHSSVLVDAKYKANLSRSPNGNIAIDSSDRYEALAFLRAARLNTVVLIYPEGVRDADDIRVRHFETFEAGEERILGMTLNVQGVSKSAGFREISTSLGNEIHRYL